MVGALASLQGGQIACSVRQAMERGVFPFWDLLRYAGFVFSAAVLMGVVVLFRLAAVRRLSSYAGWHVHPDFISRTLRLSAIVVLIATPFLIQFLRAGDVSSISIPEGIVVCRRNPDESRSVGRCHYCLSFRRKAGVA